MLGNGGKGGLQCGRRFTEQEIEQVCETVRTFPALPLTELAKTICEHLGWYTAGGAPKRDACQKLLGELEAGGRGRVVNLSRHLIFPWVEVRNLSSHVLGLVGRQIAGDWEKRWGYRPVLLETFVDPRQHPGSSYKAAGWNELGRARRGTARQMRTDRRRAQQALRRSQQSAGIHKRSHTTRPNRTSPYETVEQEGQARTQAVIEQVRLIREKLPTLLKELSRIPDPRNPLFLRQTLTTLMVYGILMFVLQTGSRRRSNETLSAPAMKEALQALFPDLESLPHHDTLYRLLARIQPERIEEAQVALVGSLIRDKEFSAYLVDGCYPIAIDGTQKMVRRLQPDDPWLQRQVGAEGKKRTQYYGYVLEAKLVLSHRVSIPLMSEFLDYHKGDNEREKQDCEQRAFYRLTERLKKSFPHLHILLLLDGLFAGGPVISRCRDYGWHFMIVLQDGSLPQVWQEYQGLKRLLSQEDRLSQAWAEPQQSFELG